MPLPCEEFFVDAISASNRNGNKGCVNVGATANIVEHLRHSKTPREFSRAREVRVANPHDLRSLRLLEYRQVKSLRDTSGADNADPHAIRV